MNHTSARALERQVKWTIMLISSLLFLTFALLSYNWNSNLLKATLIAGIGIAFTGLLLCKPRQIVLWVSLFWFLMPLVISLGPSFRPEDEFKFAASIALTQGITAWGLARKMLRNERVATAFLEITGFIAVTGVFLIVQFIALGY